MRFYLLVKVVLFLRLVKRLKSTSIVKPPPNQHLVAASEEHPSTMIEDGYLPVYVGEERRRFIIPADYLSHPLFRMLLERAYREYGFEQSCGLMLPCKISIFQEVIGAVQSKQGQFRFEDLVDDLL